MANPRSVKYSAAHPCAASTVPSADQYSLPTGSSDHYFRDLLDAAPDAMVMVDAHGRIIFVNSQTQRIFGYTREELVGKEVEVLMPMRFRDGHGRHREGYAVAPKIREMGKGLELFGTRKDGKEFPVEISLSPLHTDAGMIVVSAIRDITERKSAENELKQSVREKEILLKEVHHRVKNNLQIISSLLNFQSDVIADANARTVFQDTRARIKSIALVHERLYQSNDLTNIDFADYVQGLADDFFASYGIQRERITLELDIQPLALDVDSIINCGLIIGELLSNALKYAFPHDRRGSIRISLRTLNERFQLVVADDGVGLPPERRSLESASLGFKLVKGLVKELGGSVEVQGPPGSQFSILFRRC